MKCQHINIDLIENLIPFFEDIPSVDDQNKKKFSDYPRISVIMT